MLSSSKSSFHRPSSASIAGLAVAAVVASFIADTASAQTVWTGAEDSDWSNPNNWSNGVPSDGTAAIVSRDLTGSSGAPNEPEELDHQPRLDGAGSNGEAASLRIGSLAGADLDVINGATLTSESVSIGANDINNQPQLRLSEQSGMLRVAGPESSVTAKFFAVGFYGSGSAFFLDGASLTASFDLSTSIHAGAESTLVFDGVGTVADLQIAGIGTMGRSTVSVTDGASVTSTAMTIGGNGEGSLEISGAGSRWEIEGTNTLVVGERGEGALIIQDGGSFATASRVVVAKEAGSTGTVTIDGLGSTLTSEALFVVGEFGQAEGSVSVSDGGRLESDQALIGWNAGSSGEFTVSGAESSVGVESYLMVGFNGDGIATFSDGAVLEARNQGDPAPLVIAEKAGSQGVVNIGAASGDAATGAGIIDVPQTRFGEGRGELVFNHTTEDYIYASDIVMSPSVDAASADPDQWTISHLAGDTRMTGNNAGFLGTTNIDGGTLLITDALGGLVNVGKSGTFGGSGTIKTLNVAGGGSVSPEGTLTVDGDAEFADGSIYLVNADRSGADLLSVSGQLTLLGGTVRHQEGKADFDPLSRHRIAVAEGGVSGAFGDVESDLAFLLPELSYTDTEVWMELVRNDTDFSDVALSFNQRSLADVLADLDIDDPLVREVLMMSAPSARLAYDQLAGEVHGSRASASIQDTVVLHDLLLTRMRDVRRPDASVAATRDIASFSTADATTAQGVWMQGVGSWSEFDGDGNAAATDRDFGGFAIGYDREMASGLQLGLVAGVSTSSVSNDLGASSEAESVTVGAYLGSGATSAGLRLSGGALFSWHDVDTTRSLSSVGMGAALGSYDAGSYSVFAETSYEHQVDRLVLEPFLGLSHVGYDSESFTETGSGAALTVDGVTTETSFATLGLRGSTDLGAGTTRIRAAGMLGWRHAFGDVDPVQNAWLQGNALNVKGLPIARNELLLDAALDLDLSDAATVRLGYRGRLAEDFADHGVSFGLNVAF